MKLGLADLPFRRLIVVCVILNAVLAGIVLLSQKFLPPVVPLFYGLAEGEDQLVKSFFLVIPALASLVIILINSLIALKIQEDFLKKIIIFGGVAGTFFAYITTLKIIFLVGSF